MALLQECDCAWVSSRREWPQHCYLRKRPRRHSRKPLIRLLWEGPPLGILGLMARDPDDSGTFDMFTPPAQMTEAQRKLVEAAANVMGEPPTDADRAFMARQLVQCTLPHSNPGNVPAWSRTNGALSLVIQPYYDRKAGVYLYPYGSVPRLLLFWITTEAVKSKSRRLELGNSLTGFMREIGLNPDNGGTGAKRSDARRLKDQMQRLFMARISFEYDRIAENATGLGWLNMDVAPAGELWWDHRTPDQYDLYPSWIELGEHFSAALRAAPVPVDMRALRALKRSPLALDLYAWATYRTFTVTQAGKPSFIPWDGLARQLGGDYADPKDFKKAIKEALKKVQTFYADLRIADAQGGFIIKPSLAAIRPRA